MAAWLLTAGVALVAATAHAQTVGGLPASRFAEQREQFAPAGGVPIELRFLIDRELAGQTTRVVDATRAALTIMSEWFGPPPFPALTIVAANTPPGQDIEDSAGIVGVRVRWLTLVRDQATERRVIEGIVRQYWNAGSPQPGAFHRAVVAYTATRAIHQQLEGSNFATLRFFGGLVPFSLRSVLWSPPVADSRPRVVRFDESDAIDGDLTRGLRALQTLERYVGWPTLLDALARLRVAGGPATAEAFAQILSEVRGTDLRLLIAECLRADAMFDYAVADLQSRPASSGMFETTVTIARHGTGLFATGAAERNAVMPMRVRFADGTEAREFFDGAAPSASFVYTYRAGAIAATVDPDAMLLLDIDRQNNAIVRAAPTSKLGVRLALNWMMWLQQAVLSFTAIL